MQIERVRRKSDESVHITYRDISQRNQGGLYSISVYVEDGQIMVKAENAQWIVMTAPFED